MAIVGAILALVALVSLDSFLAVLPGVGAPEFWHPVFSSLVITVTGIAIHNEQNIPLSKAWWVILFFLNLLALLTLQQVGHLLFPEWDGLSTTIGGFMVIAFLNAAWPSSRPREG
jgi:hypothetical protein